MSTDYDIAVIGFGPCGAVATALLGQAGFRVLAVDRATEIYAKPRAMAVDHEIMRLFDNMGVADEILPLTAPFPASDHFGVDGQLIRRIDMVRPPYPLGYTPTMVFTQPPVEAALRAHAAAQPGVTVELGTALTGIEQDAERVTLDLDGRRVTASQVVACDGASSFVRQALGIGFEDLIFDEPWLVVDLLLTGDAPDLPPTAAQFCNPARPISYIVGPGAHRRFEIMLLPGEDPAAMQEEASVWRLIARWLTPAQATLWRAASYRFHALVASEWRRGRIFLAGDAAHQQPPFIGQGMCQGLRDVSNLAWKLAAVRDGADPALLDSYGEERGAHVRALTAKIKAIGRQICERDPAAARVRDAALLVQGGGKPPVLTRQEIVPPLETGFLDSAPHPARGTLFPQPALADGTLMDRRYGHGWRLVTTAPPSDGSEAPLPAADPSSSAPPIQFPPLIPGTPIDGLAGPGEAAGAPQVRAVEPGRDAVPTCHAAGAAPFTPQAIELAALGERDGILAAWFARHGVNAALIRPDHYVYGVDTDAAALLARYDQATKAREMAA